MYGIEYEDDILLLLRIKVNMLPVLWLDGILAGRRC